MEVVNEDRMKSLERWSKVAFIIAGGLFLVNAFVEMIQRYTAILGDPTFLNAVAYLSALVISVIGLLGFYHRLVDQTPRLAQVSASIATIAAIGLVVLLIWASITTLLNQPMPPGILLLVCLVAIVLSFVLFMVASLQTGIPSGTVSRLLVAFVVTWVTSLVLAFVVFGGDAPDWLAVALNSMSAVILLAIGYELRTVSGQGDPTAAPTK